MKLNVLLVTSSRKSYGSLLLERGVGNVDFGVLINESRPARNWNRLIRKILKVGIGGIVIGFYSRRWYRFAYPDIQEIAERKNIPLVKSIGFKLTDDQLADLSKYDLAISMGNGYIPKRIYSIFKAGMLNIHHEVLPDFAGGQSVVWPLVEGKEWTGFSIHKVTRKIDAGDILVVEKRRIQIKSTFGQTVKLNYLESKQQSILALEKLLATEPSQWIYHNNEANHSLTTPSLVQWIRAYRNYRKFQNVVNE